ELRPALADLAEIAALDVLEHHVGLARGVRRGFEHLSHARVLKRRLDSGFVEEACEERRVLAMLPAEDVHDARPLGALDSPRSAQIHFAHTPSGERLEERPASQLP